MKKIFLISMVMLAVILMSAAMYGCGGNESNGESNSGSAQESTAVTYKDITAEKLKSMMETNKNLVVVDVREQDEWNDGHLANSILIPTSEFQNRMSELPREKVIAVICQSGARSAQVAEYLVKSGYKEVYNLKGGISGWPDKLVK